MAQMPLKLGRQQLQIMQILWKQGRATAREITEALNGRQRIAHSTVQTLLRQLEAKGAVDHESVDRTFVFFPLYQQDAVAETVTRDLLARVFHGSVYGLVAHLLKHEKLSREDLERLRELIETEAES
jgi:BlaI family penicillinase repressor